MKFKDMIGISILSVVLATTAANAQPSGALFQKEIIYFDFDAEQSVAKSAKTIEKIAKQLEERPNLSIRLIGYADPTGDETYNMRLSQRRAEACQKALIELGVKPSRILIEAKGEEPILDVEENSLSERRRVELIPILLKN
jgi:outer membrane protein OmpA-like peptidoglycan-associated protein